LVNSGIKETLGESRGFFISKKGTSAPVDRIEILSGTICMTFQTKSEMGTPVISSGKKLLV
jgi:hypothetical protein